MRHLTFLFLTVALTTTVFGQQNKFDIGIIGGPSVSFLRGNEFIKANHDPTFVFSGGLSLQYNFPKIFSLRTDMQFERKGSVVVVVSTFTDIVGNVTGQGIIYVNSDYLTAPILLRSSFGKKVKFFVNTGTFFGYLIKQTFATTTPNYPNINIDNTRNDKRLDLGATAGFGLSIPIKDKFLISWEIRDNYGLLNVSKVPVVNDGTVKTNSTNLLIGFAYRLGTRQTETKKKR